MVSASVIVTTYNWPQALQVCLTSLLEQDTGDFEIVVADDGSTDDTRQLVERMAHTAKIRIKHVWHPDEGFRVAAIRNKAIMAAEGAYLIFMDGDCLVLPDFVRTHLDFAEKNCFVSGKRSYLRDRLTQAFLQGRPILGRHARAIWLLRGLANQCTRPLQFLRLPLRDQRFRRAQDWTQAQTCNLGVWRDDAIKINGFEEQYQGHGLEDSDFVVRLLRAGNRRKLGDFASIVLHLNHPRRKGGASNGALFKALLESGRFRAERGLADLALGPSAAVG